MTVPTGVLLVLLLCVTMCRGNDSGSPPESPAPRTPLSGSLLSQSAQNADDSKLRTLAEEESTVKSLTFGGRQRQYRISERSRSLYLRPARKDHFTTVAPDDKNAAFLPLEEGTETKRIRKDLQRVRRNENGQCLHDDSWFNCAEKAFPGRTEDYIIRKGIDTYCSFVPGVYDTCSLCRSDDACHAYGDCCVWKQTSTAPTTLLRCQAPRGSSTGFFMVVSCNLSSSALEVQERCEKPRVGNWEDENPVTDDATGVTYRNSFCARCNGVLSFSPWFVEVNCEKNAAPLYEAVSAEAVYTRVARTGECSIAYQPRGSPRTCSILSSPLVSSCGRWTSYWQSHDPRVVRACDSYTAVVREYGFQGSYKYKNIFCYMCSQRKSWAEVLMELMVDLFIKSPDFLPLSAILSLRADPTRHDAGHKGGYSSTAREAVARAPPSGHTLPPDLRHEVSFQNDSCPEGEAWDPHQCTCRPLLCSLGKALHNNDCRSGFKSTAFSYRVCLKIDAAMARTSRAEFEDFVARVSNFLDIGADVPGTEITEMELLQLNRSCSGEEELVSMTASLLVLPSVPEYQDVIQTALLSQLSGSNWSGSKESLRVTFMDSRRCDPRNRHQHTEETCESIGISQFGFEANLPFALKGISKHSYVLDVKPLLMCSQIDLTLDDIRYEDNADEILILGSNCSLSSSFFSKSNTSVRVCFREYAHCYSQLCPTRLILNESLGSASWRNQSDTNSLSPLGVLSFVCSCVSLVFFSVCVGLYCLHKELRTLVGCQKMVMVIEFALALGLFEFGAWQTENSTVCIIIGVLCHFLWLVATFQMNVCTTIFFFHVTFPIAARSKMNSMKKVFVWASLYSLGVPAAVVGATIGMSWYYHGDSGYGGQICYLQASRALVRQLTLGLPIGILVLLNLILFAAAIVSLKMRPKLSASRDSKVGLLSCVRLSLLTGAVWLLGFLSEAFPSLAMQYIFTLTFGLYGVFIFLDLLIILRARGLLVRCPVCCTAKGKQGSAPKSTPDTSATSSV